MNSQIWVTSYLRSWQMILQTLLATLPTKKGLFEYLHITSGTEPDVAKMKVLQYHDETITRLNTLLTDYWDVFFQLDELDERTISEKLTEILSLEPKAEKPKSEESE